MGSLFFRNAVVSLERIFVCGVIVVVRTGVLSIALNKVRIDFYWWLGNNHKIESNDI